MSGLLQPDKQRVWNIPGLSFFLQLCINELCTFVWQISPKKQGLGRCFQKPELKTTLRCRLEA